MKTFDLGLEAKAVGIVGEFEGYASTFGNVDLGGDSVQPGAFIESVVKAKSERRTIPMLWMHQQDQLLGKWTDIAEDAKGLYVKGKLNLATNQGREKYEHLKENEIGGMSIGYRVPAGGAEQDERRRGVQNLVKLDLREISLVTMPMNIEARVTGVKADIHDLRDRLAAGERLSEREWERLLKSQLDLSNAEAERAVRLHLKGQGEPGKGQGDPDDTANDGLALLRALRAG
ncbi:HK97 family phage prohead protease [Terrihabitans sp. B22-R8]|uniref:HK97 family phage prohead protease n=1 Tax=Terrihabitans sp. B22-R8 TaxID=3425128 RepID=UPI00403C38D6